MNRSLINLEMRRLILMPSLIFHISFTENLMFLSLRLLRINIGWESNLSIEKYLSWSTL